MPNQFKVVIM